MKHILVFLACSFVSSVCLAQVKATVSFKHGIQNVQNANVTGEWIVFESQDIPSIRNIAIIDIDTDYKFKKIRIDLNGKKINATKVSDNQYIVSSSGDYNVEVIVFDPEKGIDETDIQFTLKASPDKPDSPDKPNDPDKPNPPEGKFDNLAIRVAAISATITEAEKRIWNKTMNELIEKMVSNKIIRIEEARAYIESKNLSGSSLSKMLSDDASKRTLSFQQSIDWYREVEKGTR